MFDALVDSNALNGNLTRIAAAIREKTGDTASLAFPDGFISAINSFSGEAPPAVIVSGQKAKQVLPYFHSNTYCFTIGQGNIYQQKQNRYTVSTFRIKPGQQYVLWSGRTYGEVFSITQADEPVFVLGEPLTDVEDKLIGPCLNYMKCEDKLSFGKLLRFTAEHEYLGAYLSYNSRDINAMLFALGTEETPIRRWVNSPYYVYEYQLLASRQMYHTTTVYEVQPGHTYFFYFPEGIGNRLRVGEFDTIPEDAPMEAYPEAPTVMANGNRLHSENDSNFSSVVRDHGCIVTVTKKYLAVYMDGNPDGSSKEIALSLHDITQEETPDASPNAVLPRSFTENGEYRALDYGYNGFSEINIDVNPLLQNLYIGENGVYEPPEGVYGFSKVTVNIPPSMGEGILVPYLSKQINAYTYVADGCEVSDGTAAYSTYCWPLTVGHSYIVFCGATYGNRWRIAQLNTPLYTGMTPVKNGIVQYGTELANNTSPSLASSITRFTASKPYLALQTSNKLEDIDVYLMDITDW